ncbi:hypothetical protein WE348_20900 (plasmid) [Alteromonas macleodii]|uniref:hypothetical protein n=1 Tax=Alteromonas macleodii TaxID=28108 RepID=UPI0030CD806F
MKDLTWFGLIEVVGTSSCFVKKNVEGDGYRFECDPDAFSLSITEIIQGNSNVILSLEFNEDGELKVALCFGEEYDSLLFIENELDEFFTLLREDGVIAYDD